MTKNYNCLYTKILVLEIGLVFFSKNVRKIPCLKNIELISDIKSRDVAKKLMISHCCLKFLTNKKSNFFVCQDKRASSKRNNLAFRSKTLLHRSEIPDFWSFLSLILLPKFHLKADVFYAKKASAAEICVDKPRFSYHLAPFFKFFQNQPIMKIILLATRLDAKNGSFFWPFFKLPL